MGHRRGVYSILVGIPEGKKPFGRTDCRWEKILKRIFKKWYEEVME